jgi:serine/threonine protein kinase/tetratricopeptide (TPR) repeat protein
VELLFDRFQPEKKLGEGGFAQVWLARDLQREALVACKLLSLADAVAKLRFHREFMVLHRLDHVGVIKVYDYLQNGKTLYSMEFVEGTNIRDYLHKYHWREAGPLDKPYYRDTEGFLAAIGVLLQISDTLSYLHQQAIVHRDLKPENILYSYTDDHVKILDFGLVREKDLDAFTTQAGLIQGTPSYIAPEQIQGREVDLRADLYSLGVIIFELLTGQVPFRALNVMAVMDMHLKQAPPSARAENPLIPVQMENVILKLLAKEPARRFSTAAEVAQELRAARERVLRGDAEESVSFEMPTMAFRIEAPENLLIAPWIGKNDLLAAFHGSVADLVGGKGSFHLISGDHGSGKSRLLEEVQAEAVNRQAEVYAGSAKEEASLPYQLFQAIVAQVARRHSSDMGAEGAVIARNFPLLDDGGGHVTLDALTLANLDPKGEKARLFHSFFALFKRLAAKRPIVLLLDDLQWADESSLELLGHLVYSFTGAEAGAPLMLVGAYVPEEVHSRPAEAWLKQKVARDAAGTALPPMTEEELAQFVQALLSHPESPPPRFLAALAEQTGGNPFFVLETLRSLIGDNQLKRKTGNLAWDFSMFLHTDRASMTLKRMPMPKSVQDALQYRLRAFGEEEMLALQSAALIGRRFPFLIWQQVTDLPEEKLLDLADRLLAAKVLVERPGEILEFSSEQARQVLTEPLSDLRKKRLHARIADAIFKHYSPVPEDQVVPLATNLEAAGRREEALPWFLQAAEKASRNYHLQIADGLWRSVSDICAVLPGQEAVRARGLGELGDVAVYSSRYDEAEEFFEQAIDLLPPDQEAFCHWNIRLANCRGQRGNIQEMHAGLYTLLPAIQQRGFKTSEAWCRAYLGISLWEKGKPEESLVELEAALALFQELHLMQGVLLVHDNLGIPHYYLGQDEQAREAMQRGLEQARRYGDVRRQLVSMSNLMAYHSNHGELDKVRELFAQSLPLAESMGDWRLYCFNLYSGAMLYDQLGERDRAAGYAQKALDLAQEIGAREIYAHCLKYLGEAALQDQSWEEGESRLAEAQETYAQLGVGRQLPGVRLLRAYGRLAQSKSLSDLEDLLREVQALREQEDHFDICQGLVFLGRAHLILGQREDAGKAAQEALETAQKQGYRHLASQAQELLDAAGRAWS